MISTLKAIFQGRKELFEGLAIAETTYDWTRHLVDCCREQYRREA